MRFPAIPSLSIVACIAFIVPVAAIQQDSEPRPQEVLVPPADSEGERSEATAEGFSTAQLEQLVAPIALYPDALLSQVLMASTYPLEIVEAARFVAASPGLEGEELEQELRKHDWAPSVKALCAFPEVLQRMSDHLDWTRDLGDAFLAQEAELMDSVQQMRQHAQEAGSLESSDEQEVVVREDRIIEIVTRSPEVVYVPVYYPTAVYGGWGYRWWWYPSLFAPPPPLSPFFFYRPVRFHFPFWSHCHWSWRRSHCFVDVDVHNRFVGRTFRDPRPFRIDDAREPRVEWRHDPRHRQGVTYRSPDVTKKFRRDVLSPDHRLDRADDRGRLRPPSVPRDPRRPITAPGTVPRPPRTERPERPERPDVLRPDRPGTPRPERPDVRRPDRSEGSRPDRPDRPEVRGPDRPDARQPTRPEPRRPEARPERPTRPTVPTPPSPRVEPPVERDRGALRGSRRPAFERAAQERGRRSLERSSSPRTTQPTRPTPPRPPAGRRTGGG